MGTQQILLTEMSSIERKKTILDLHETSLEHP